MKLNRQTDEEGLPLVQQLLDNFDPLVKVMSANDFAGVTEQFQKYIPTLRKLLPHVKDEEVRQIQSNLLHAMESLIDKMAHEKSPEILQNFLRKTYMNLFSNRIGIRSSKGGYRPGKFNQMFIWISFQ